MSRIHLDPYQLDQDNPLSQIRPTVSARKLKILFNRCLLDMAPESSYFAPLLLVSIATVLIVSSKYFAQRDIKARSYLTYPAIKAKHGSAERVFDNGAFEVRDQKGCSYVTVHSNGRIWQRLHAYNAALTAIREDILSKREPGHWKPVEPFLHVIEIEDDNFCQLSNFSNVKTIILPFKTNNNSDWSSLNDTQNLVVQNYYEWTASKPLSEWIVQPGVIKAKYDVVFNKTCNEHIQTSMTPKSLEYLYFHGRSANNYKNTYPEYFYTLPPRALFFIHIVQDVVITRTGDIFGGNFKLVPLGWGHDTGNKPPAGYESSPVYREVFILSQQWGDAFFHKMLEALPRLMPYLQFVKRHKDILVHVFSKNLSPMLELLGIGSERIVTGISRAELVYLPQGTPCGYPIPQETQLLSHELRGRMSKLFPGMHNRTKKTIVLIRRSGNRHFVEQASMEHVVAKIADDYNLTFHLFPDNPLPSMERTFRMFNQAVVVVAPHGAGLTNMLYCEPGVLILEGVCNLPHVNLCYQWTAHGLGHRYHGIPSRRGCEDHNDLPPESIDTVLRSYMKLMKHLKMLA